ncbi:MAG: hypothetical protein NBV56_01590 [Aquirufa antheringensis]|nr:hypothetical protein [Aquirufa antheringensis]
MAFLAFTKTGFYSWVPLQIGALYMFLTSLDSSLTFLDTAGHIVATPEDPSTALLETVNYIEHYGLQRDFAKTTFERVKPAHRLSMYDFTRLVSTYLI